MLRKILAEIKSHFLIYLLLIILLTICFFIRAYRAFDLVGFYYDQGRDALVIWNLWHQGKLFLIGPVTGLKGIFLGPFYYYLIAPFYLLGRGNPVYPAYFLAFLSTLAVLFLFVLGVRMHSRTTGLIAAIIATFSYRIFTHSRWLSNPNPILLTSVIFLWSLWEISSVGKQSKIQNRKLNLWWILASLVVGLSLQLESASAVFYIPIFLIFTIWQRKSLPSFKVLLLSGLVFIATLLPQVVFNFRHENILLNNFKNLFFEEKAFRGLTKFIFEERSKYFWNVFSKTIFDGKGEFSILFMTIAFSSILASFRKLKNKVIPVFSIFFTVPILGYYLFQGNYGNIYDYYMSGYYLPFILLFSIGLGELWQKKFGFLIVIFFFYHFFSLNFLLIKNYLTATPQTRPIALEDEVAAVNYIFDDALGSQYNVDIYVPPVIPYSYDYLLLWQGYKRCGTSLCGKVDEEKDYVYLIYEPENIHVERWENWINGYNQRSVLLSKERFGNVTVEKRKRLK